jgi:hypothetical protein
MPKKLIFLSSLFLTSALFTGCSNDDKESTRVKAASLGITHDSAQCPKVSGLYKSKTGVTSGILEFAVLDNGTKLQFADKSVGLDGHVFLLDGKAHDESENGKSLKYTAGCANKTIRLVGSIDNKDKLDMTISEKDGGTVSIKSGDSEGDYEKVIGQNP